MPIFQHPAGVFVLPSNHIGRLLQALVKGIAQAGLAIVGGHLVPFVGHIAQTEGDRVVPHLFDQLVDCRFNRKNTLGCAIAAVGTRRHPVGVDDVI